MDYSQPKHQLLKKDLEDLITILDDEFKVYCNKKGYDKQLKQIHDAYTLYQIEYYTRYGLFLK